MSIFQKIFGTQPQAQTVNPNQPPTVQSAPTVTPAPGQGIVPDNSQQQQQNPQTPQSPLDGFKDLFKIDPNAKPTEQQTSMFNVDSAKLLEAAKSKDFTQIVPKELLAKISAGGDEATGAFQQAMNLVAANTFATNTQASTKILETALTRQREEFLKELPGIIKQASVSENLRSSNPLFNNPATAPVMNMVQKQLQLKHPEATAAELQKMTEDYMSAFAQAATPKTETQSSASKSDKGTQDWSRFLEDPSSTIFNS